MGRDPGVVIMPFGKSGFWGGLGAAGHVFSCPVTGLYTLLPESKTEQTVLAQDKHLTTKTQRTNHLFDIISPSCTLIATPQCHSAGHEGGIGWNRCRIALL